MLPKRVLETDTMALFGKRKITANKLFSDADELLLPTRQSIEKNWWPIVEIEERAVEFKSQVVTELLLLRLFAIDLAIFSAFQGEVQDAMRDQIHIHASENIPDILDDIPLRQQAYGEAWANHSLSHLPNSYSVVKKFIEICELPESVTIQMGVTELFSTILTSTKKFFDKIQKSYQIIP